jgi:hypothetical protein
MSHPARYARGQIRYSGRVDRRVFQAWMETPDGRRVLDSAQPAIRFALFGKTRAACNRIWRELTSAARSEAATAALQRETDRYLEYLGTLAHARGLPCRGVDLHRLVAVPRLLVNSDVERRVDVLMATDAAFGPLSGDGTLRGWFIPIFIGGIESAVLEARPSPKRPLPAGGDWIVVGVNDGFEWRVPFRGPAWPGHYYLLELTRSPITRAVRKAAADAMAQMEASLGSLPRDARAGILREAAISLDAIGARAS